MRRVALAIVAVVAISAGAYALGTASGDDDRAGMRRVIVGASTDDNATHDKWVTAECPDGMRVIGGGAVIPHGNEIPGVALYWSAPYNDHDTDGWWAAAQDTRRGKRPWLLQVQAICTDGVESVNDPGGSLPPESFSPAGRPPDTGG
jgi:hypothetical protein